MRDSTELATRLALAEAALREAGGLALCYFRTRLDIVNKARTGSFDPVTHADKEIEVLLRERIKAAFPDDGLIGEEFGQLSGRSGYDWVVDPIDGTRAFISGHLGWGVLAGVLEDGIPAIGLAYQPYTDEMFSGTATRAGLVHGGEYTALATSQRQRLENAIVYSTDPAMLRTPEDRRALDRIAARARMLRFGGDCYSLCLLALGQIDVVVEGYLEPYDILPIVPLVRAAGGVVTNADGESDFSGGMVVASASPALHREVLTLIRRGSAPQ